jgi:hypothetical protein
MCCSKIVDEIIDNLDGNLNDIYSAFASGSFLSVICRLSAFLSTLFTPHSSLRSS